MPYFGQELMLRAQDKGPLTDKAYLAALEKNHRLSQREGIDAVMDACTSTRSSRRRAGRRG